VLARIEERLGEPIQVRELASEANMSLFHFARMFKLATGHSPHKYITVQRMERAKALLAGSEMPILGVARTVGYQTQAHFTGVFARNVGTTPKVYRVRHRDGRLDGVAKADGIPKADGLPKADELPKADGVCGADGHG